MTATWTPPAPHERRPAPTPARPASNRRASGPGLDRSDIKAPFVGRSLWVIIGTVIAVGGLGWGTFNVIDVLAHEEFRQSATFPAAGVTTIEVDNDGGWVEIVGTDTDIIRLDAQISRGLRETGYSWEVVGDTLQVRGTCPLLGSQWCWVKYRLEVPTDVAVVVSNDNSRVAVSNIEGAVTINADNGRVELNRIAGPLVVDNDNGRIQGTGLSSDTTQMSNDNGSIDLDYLLAPTLVDVGTDNGSIDIAVPPIDGGYDVETDTDNGSQNVEVVDDPESTHAIRAETSNGSITVRSTG